jgi:hypothetical protein
MLISSYLVALLLTILIEVFVALIFGYKCKKEILSVILLNLITQPVLNYFLLINSYFSLVSVTIQFILLLEIIVILVEWQLLVWTLQRKLKSLFVLSIVMNLASLTIGLSLFT